MKYKLLVLDIDGTVTNSRKEISEKTRKAIIQLQENGIQVVIASGRAPKGVFPVAKCLDFDRFGNYILAFNGARIIDFKTGKCVYEKRLPPNIPGRLWEDAVKYDLGILTYTENTIVTGTVPEQYMDFEAEISHMELEYHSDFCRYVDFPVNGCLLTGDPDLIEVAEPIFVHKYLHETEIFRSEPFFLEIVPKNVDKAYSLKHLLRILGIRREEMVCCGDGYNDVSMIQYAGLGVAMANAQERLKALANYVTVNDNDHDGIVEVIEKFF